MSDQDDFDLSSLDDDELAQQMHDDLYDGLKDEIEESVNILLERGWAPYDVERSQIEIVRIRHDRTLAKTITQARPAFCAPGPRFAPLS